MKVFNFNNLSLAAEIGSAFGMLVITTGALIYICQAKDRARSATNIFIFVTLIIAFSFSASLAIYDLSEGTSKALNQD